MGAALCLSIGPRGQDCGQGVYRTWEGWGPQCADTRGRRGASHCVPGKGAQFPRGPSTPASCPPLQLPTHHRTPWPSPEPPRLCHRASPVGPGQRRDHFLGQRIQGVRLHTTNQSPTRAIGPKSPAGSHPATHQLSGACTKVPGFKVATRTVCCPPTVCQAGRARGRTSRCSVRTRGSHREGVPGAPLRPPSLAAAPRGPVGNKQGPQEASTRFRARRPVPVECGLCPSTFAPWLGLLLGTATTRSDASRHCCHF